VPQDDEAKPAQGAQEYDPAAAAVTQHLETKEKTKDQETRRDDEFMGAWG
jgi:hypothetical protein